MITTRIRFTYPSLLQHPHTTQGLARQNQGCCRPTEILLAALIVFGLVCGVQAQPVISSQAGYTITWNGNDGEYSGLSVPNNIATASRGSQTFGSGQLTADGEAQDIDNVIDGAYGNASSWISGTNQVPSPLDTAAGTFIGVRFANSIAISSIAWGRENNETTQAGGYPDRWQGVYTLQVTTKANPDAATTETGNAATGWVTIGTVTTGEAQKSATFRPWMRHLYNVAQGGNPIQATGLRIKVSWAAIAIDEIEVNSPVPAQPADATHQVSGKQESTQPSTPQK